MKKISKNLLSKIFFLAYVVLPLSPTSNAQTWKIPEKKLPVVIENSSCNPTTDTVGIKNDQSLILTCQSGNWTRQASASPFACYAVSFTTPNNETPTLVGIGTVINGKFNGLLTRNFGFGGLGSLISSGAARSCGNDQNCASYYTTYNFFVSVNGLIFNSITSISCQ